VADLIRMHVDGVMVEGNRPVVVLKEESGDRVLPILIGPAEAMAISLELEGQKPPRPLTHDLLCNILETLGVSISRVVVTQLVEDTYHAQITLIADGEDGEQQIDARPSDAIALALRAQSPIFATDDLLERVQHQRDGFVIDSPPTIH
jgi:bifunctional DNase/RNase